MKKRTKKTVSVAGRVFLRSILSTVLCAIIFLSMMAIATAMFSDVVGYQVYDPQTEQSEEFYFADGATTKDKPKGSETVIVTDLREVADDTLLVFQLITQVMMLIVFAIFPYHILWEFGNRDDTNVRYKGQRQDLWRGFRVGGFASIPYGILWVLLILAKCGVIPSSFDQVYRLAHFPYMPYVNWVMPAGSLANTPAWQLLLLLPILLYLPLVCGISYRMGHKQFSLRERLVFGKNETKTDEI